MYRVDHHWCRCFILFNDQEKEKIFTVLLTITKFVLIVLEQCAVVDIISFCFDHLHL